MPEPADLILVDTDVWCGDAARRWAKAVAIRGDRIVAVGTDDDVRDRKGPGTQVLSLAGKAVVPGFQDSHIHPAYGARNLLNVNLDDLHAREDYLGRIKAVADANPGLDWIVGGGWYSPVLAATGGPRKEDLDAVVPDRPVFLMNSDVHAAWVNSRALEAAGLSADSPDPWDGYLVRDPDGSLTGCLQEGAAYTVLREVIAQPSGDQWKAYVLRAQQELHALGVTGWQDAWVEPALLRAYRDLADEGSLTMRVVASQWWDRHLGMEQVDGFVERREWATGGTLDADTIKIMLDGCPESCTASMLEPFEGAFGERHGTGIQFVDDETLHRALVALGRARVPGPSTCAGRPCDPQRPRCRRSRPHRQRPERRAPPPRAHPAPAPRRRAPAAAPRRGGEPPALLEPARPRDRAARDPARGGARCAAVPDRRPRAKRRRDVLRQRLARVHARTRGSSWRWRSPGRCPASRTPSRSTPPSASTSRTAMSAFARGSAYVNHDDDAGVIAPGLRADLAVLDRNPFDRRARRDRRDAGGDDAGRGARRVRPRHRQLSWLQLNR